MLSLISRCRHSALVRRYNKLLSVVRSTLQSAEKAVKGLVVMSQELERLSGSLMDGKVPDAWHAKAYPSLKPLGSWVNDLLDRLAFLQRWIDDGSAPAVFWFPGFFFPQSFVTGTLQNFSRKHKQPIDTLVLDFTVMDPAGAYTTAPDDGCYISGLFLEGPMCHTAPPASQMVGRKLKDLGNGCAGASWSAQIGSISEALPKLLYDPMPERTQWSRPFPRSIGQLASLRALGARISAHSR